MKRLISTLAVCVSMLILACDSATIDPGLDPQFAATGGLHLRDTDANEPVPADTTVQLNDTLRFALAAGNGKGPQNNKNVSWSTSNAAVVSIVPNKGTAVAVAQSIGTAVVSVSLGGTTISVTIHVTAGAGHHYEVTASSYTAEVGTSVSITAQLRDVANNPVLEAGRAVTWSSTNGGSFTPPASVTDGNGVATTSFTVSTVAGTSHIVTATDNLGTTGSSSPIVTETGPASQMVAHAGDGQSAAAGTDVAVPPAVKVTDQYGNPVQGVPVNFVVSSGGGSITGPNAITDAGGVAAVGSWTLGATAGPNTLDAISAGLPTVTFTATGTVGAPAEIELTATEDSVPPGGTTTITALVTDAYGNPVGAGVLVSWSSTNGGSFSANPTATDASGEATVDFTAANAGSVDHVITATAGAASENITISTTNTAPVATDDAFNAIGNVTVPVAAPGVLANDSDAESAVSAVPGVIATLNGGTVTMNADGSFTYLSAAGFSGSDSFDYAATDGTVADTATVTMTVAAPVWYVDNTATAPGDGRDVSPFTELKSAETASSPMEQIFLLEGDGTANGYDEGIVLKNGQLLTGQGVPADITTVVNGTPLTLFSANGAPEMTRNTTGPTIQLAQNNTVRGVDVASTDGAGITGSAFGSFNASSTQVTANGGAAVDLSGGSVNATFSQLSSSASASSGIALSNLTGTFNAPAGSLTGAAGAALMVTGGNAAITYGGSITSVVQRPVLISGRTGGAVTIAGAIDADGLGIRIHNNSGGAVTFTGGISVSTTEFGVALISNAGATVDFNGGGLVIVGTGGTGFFATGGGTISVKGAGNSIATTASPGLQVQNTTIDATGLTFESVNVDGAPFGIALTNTGVAGGLTVTGAGGACHRSATACSGGTIGGNVGGDGGIAGSAIYLADTRDVSLSNMRFTDASNFAIRGINVTNFEGDALLIDGVFGSSVPLEEAAVAFDNLGGTASINSSFIAGGVTDNVRVRNTAALVLSFGMQADTIGLNHTLSGRDGIQLSSTSGTFDAAIDANYFIGTRASPFAMRATGTVSAGVNFTNNTVANTHTNKIAGAAGVTLSAGGAVADNVNVDYTISNNSVIGSRGVGISVTKTLGVVNLDGVITGNLVGSPGIANSGSEQGAGMFVSHATKGTHRVRIDGNNVHQYSGAGGIFVQAGGVSALADPGVVHDGVLQATIVNNTMSNPGTNNPGSFVDALFIAPGTNSGDQYTVCLDVGQGGSNDLANGGRPAEGGGAFSVIANAPGSNAILKLAGYPIATHVGSAAEGPIVTTLQSLNSTGGTGYAETPNLTTTYAGNNAAGVSCNLP